MAWVAEWLNQHLQAKTADMVLDDTMTYLKRRNGLIDSIAPLKTYSHRKFMQYVVKEIRTTASLVALGSEIPTTSQGSFERIIAEMFKLGLAYVYDEPTQWDMKEAMEMADAKNIMVQDVLDDDGNVITGGTNNDLAQMLFGTVGRMAMAFIDKMDSMTWKALQFGEINAVDARTNVAWTLDYKESAPSPAYSHFPAALATTARWDQYSTANGINNLYQGVRTYIRTNGFKPDMTIMADVLYQDLMQQQSTKDAASSMTVTQVGSVSPEMLAELFRRRGIPPYVEMDEMYEEEDSSKNISRLRFHNDNRFTFAKKMMGQRAMGPTLEAAGMFGAEESRNQSTQAGIYIVTREIKKIPPVDATEGVAMALPMFSRPKLFYSQQVKDAA